MIQTPEGPIFTYRYEELRRMYEAVYLQRQSLRMGELSSKARAQIAQDDAILERLQNQMRVTKRRGGSSR